MTMYERLEMSNMTTWMVVWDFHMTIFGLCEYDLRFWPIMRDSARNNALVCQNWRMVPTGASMDKAIAIPQETTICKRRKLSGSAKCTPVQAIIWQRCLRMLLSIESQSCALKQKTRLECTLLVYITSSMSRSQTWQIFWELLGKKHKLWQVPFCSLVIRDSNTKSVWTQLVYEGRFTIPQQSSQPTYSFDVKHHHFTPCHFLHHS